MKKNYRLLTIVFLVLSICFNSFVVLSYADNELEEGNLNIDLHESFLLDLFSPNTGYASNITEYNNFMTAYFDNLTYNIGVNYKGSCGYVAMAMLLSYYDTFLNDGIVSEQYDVVSDGTNTDIISRRNSPGVLRDTIQNVENVSDKTLKKMSASDYYLKMNSISHSSLHAKLITIGASYGYYDFDVESDDYSATTNFSERLNVLNHYLQNDVGLNLQNYSTLQINRENNPSESDLVRDFVVESILAGNPVLLGLGGLYGVHAVIAYDCELIDEENMEYAIYCHMGYGANKTHVTPESQGFSIYRSALAIDFNLEHTHSNNYRVTTIENNIPISKTYCYNECAIEVYTDDPLIIEHDSSIKYHSSTQHVEKCSCGYINNLFPHNLSYSYHTPTQHYKSCSDCNYFGPETHSYTSVLASTLASGHQRACVCGQTITEAHYKSYRRPYNRDEHYVYCECGYLIETEYHTMVIGWKPGTSTCRGCGYIRDDNGMGEVIMGTDTEGEV